MDTQKRRGAMWILECMMQMMSFYMFSKSVKSRSSRFSKSRSESNSVTVSEVSGTLDISGL